MLQSRKLLGEEMERILSIILLLEPLMSSKVIAEMLLRIESVIVRFTMFTTIKIKLTKLKNSLYDF